MSMTPLDSPRVDPASLPPKQPYDFKLTNTDLFSALVKARKQFGGKDKFIMTDVDERQLTYKEVVRGALGLGSALRQFADKGESVGLMLPTGAGSVIGFYALTAYGRVPAMVNFTAGSRNIKACMVAAEVKTIITAHKFIKLAALEPLIAELENDYEIVYLEDVREGLTLRNKIAGALGPVFPSLFKARIDPDDAAVTLFTSGTEGDPKGVVLSHRNILANIAQVRAHVGFCDKTDSVFNPLPTFHCFGLSIGVVLPLMAGTPVIFHPSPLQPREIAKRVKLSRPTFIIATDTFLNQYARASKPDDLASIRLAVCGAERVRDETRLLVRKKFGIEILEGYGATEAAPLVSANLAENNRPGTVGKFIPDMEYRVEPVEGIDEGGRLFIRGPNVMKGYLRANNPGVLEPLPDGWHDTGDIVVVDDEEFIRIKGRVKRFAKIAGEMVSLAVVENCAGSIWPDDMHAAATLPDARKGEQIVLLSTSPDVNHADMLAWAQNHGVTELAVPRKVFHIDEVPLLGTGKVNYGEVTRMALEKLEEGKK